MTDKSTNEICILKRCGFKTQRQIKIKANNDILEKLELSQELIDSKDDGDNIFICLQHLHPVINVVYETVERIKYLMKDP
jgi:uncharacterized heparinase superfamily protein